jgi:predicted metalloprotease with PDZ domain
MKIEKHKIGRLIVLKAKVFDTLRKLEMLQNTMNQVVEGKNKDLKELQELENTLKNRYAKAKKLVG